MGMLDKNPATKQKKSMLTHTPGGVEVENQVARETIINSVRRDMPKKKAEKTTSIRIAISTRNALNSLVTLGSADTVNALLDELITTKIESLSPDQQRTYDIINDVATQREK